ncbi:MAG: hypothetical protein Q9208_003511 [Pyrenodesmia sp. 3 TL-2023]
MASTEPYHSPPSSPKASKVDPVLRNALRYTISAKEYKTLHEYLVTRSPTGLRKRAPPPAKVDALSRASDDRNAAAIRASLRVFIASQIGLQIWDLITTRLLARGPTKAAEFVYNAMDNEGWFRNKPWWWGSWMLMPLATGQLLHAFVYDRDCFPKAYGDFILSHTPNYLQRRPRSYPPSLPWPEPNKIVDSLAEMSRLHWPPFTSPILFPNIPSPLPSSLASIAPITDPAHPSIPHLSCALLHPRNPSCSSTFLTYIVTAFPPLAKFFAIIFALFSLPRYKAFLSSPAKELNSLAKRILRMTLFITMAIGTSWGSICLFANLLPRNFLPTQRWFLGGFLGGLWGFVERKGGRANFLYSVRLSIDSAWKVGKKRGWWKGVRGGDLGVFVAGLMVINAVYERDAAAVQGSLVRKGLGFLRGEGLVDRVDKEVSKGDEVERKGQ